MKEIRRYTSPDISTPNPWGDPAPSPPVQTYDRSGQRGGKSCLPFESTPGGTAADLSPLIAGGAAGPIDISGNWGNSPTSYTINKEGDQILIDDNGVVYYSSASSGTYNNVIVCASNLCGEACTDEFTIVINPS